MKRTATVAAVLACLLITTAQADYVSSVLQSNPVGYWRLGEANGATTAVNIGSAGPALNGTYTPSKTSVPGLLPEGSNSAAWFNGTNQWVQASGINTTGVFSGDWTIETWFERRLVGGDWEGVVSNNGSGSGNIQGPLLTFFDGASGRSRHWLGMNPAGQSPTPDIYVDLNQYGGGNAAYLNKPIYAALSLAGNQFNLRVNIDGTWLPTATTTLSRTLDRDNSVFLIGRHWMGDTQMLDGTIDEVAVYNRALGADEISAHFDASVPEPATMILFALGSAAVLARRRRLA